MLIIDEYLSGISPDSFYKKELFQFKKRIGLFKSIIAVLESFKSDFNEILLEISQSSTDYIDSYETFIISALETEIEKMKNEKELIIDREDFHNNNQYKKSGRSLSLA